MSTWRSFSLSSCPASFLLPPADKALFVSSSIWALPIFLPADVLSEILDDSSRSGTHDAARGGLGAFLYLEGLDASFSFDGVIGAFALTQNLFIIATGLGIGAMYVRSMTIMLVHRGTLAEYRFLEHGAFYAILVLSIIMYVQTVIEVREVVTGLLGSCIIGTAFVASLRRRKPESAAA